MTNKQVRRRIRMLREEGATLAEFHPDGNLSRVVLGAAPPPRREGDDAITPLERLAGDSQAEKSIDDRLFGKLPGFRRES